MAVIKKELWNNQEVYLLEMGELRVWVCPADGMNIYQLAFKDHMVIKYNEERQKKNMTHGIPILYPTPNRTKKNSYQFNEETYCTQMHGCVKNQPFEVISESCSKDMVRLVGRLLFVPGEELFEKFPFRSRLEIRIELMANQLCYQYEVFNEDEKALPYGFAIHPFFEKNKEEVMIQVLADQVMDMNEEKLPTGDLIPTFDNQFDLHDMTAVSSLDLDHVYTKINGQPLAKIQYDKLSIELEADSIFSHVVVYTPNEDFFCIENQTCSTDAVNLYNKGYKEESGLQVIEAKGKERGRIVFRFSY